ncbi:hypothetical protein EJ03DRAFT_150776 [Teratosphaeria nubilosa]|uniref:BZIP domain-containing protein n=1 Tax=Teratosphaeria nubilosa TaxID=161662 RepID=A0A6G1LK90_9PEZI|nr:hypothetical protein EJ03DRAFT_150776 [Teratosphaeria nubilosa]
MDSAHHSTAHLYILFNLPIRPLRSPSSNRLLLQVNKRKRNTEAARRYRQRKVDRVTELEEALAAMTAERDELRLKLARSETKAEVLRVMFSDGQKERLAED